MNIPFSPPDITEAEARAAYDTLLSGWITTGPKTKALEREVARFCGTRRAVCLNSATACMESAMRLLGIGPGDEVITSAYTYTATASAVCHVGAKLILVDVKPGTAEIDPAQIASAINGRTKMVIPVDIGGLVCDYRRIFEVVESKRFLFQPRNEYQEAIGRVVVMADAAHAFGSSRYGIKTGGIADFTAFSFHAVKNLTTGEGGALTWREFEGLDDEELYRKLQLLTLHGQSKDALAKTQAGGWEYDIIGPWHKCNMTDVMAAVGLVQLQRYPSMLARRKEMIERYDNAFMNKPLTIMEHYTGDMTSNGHLYLTRLNGKDESGRNQTIARMEERGISCNVHFKPLPMMTAYRSLGFDIRDYMNAYETYSNELSLPLYSKMTDEQQDYVIHNYLELI